MATKGVAIDITKPEHYRLKNGCEVLNIKIQEKSEWPLKVLFRDKENQKWWTDYSLDGFHFGEEGTDFDLMEIDK